MGRFVGLALALAAGVATSAAAAPAPPSAGPGAPAAVPSAPGAVATLPSPPAEATRRPGREPPRVFISPSGEPFRQGPGQPDPLKAWFEQVDAAHKGYIDRADLRADAARFFKQLDENGDNVIDGFEVADYEAKIAPELAEWTNGDFPGEYGQARGQRPGGGDGGPGEGGRGGGHQRGRRGGDEGQSQGSPDQASQEQAGQQRPQRGGQRGVFQLINEPEPVADADFDLDSHITFDEWMRATDRRFAILDANKDGRVTLEELRARFLPAKK